MVDKLTLFTGVKGFEEAEKLAKTVKKKEFISKMLLIQKNIKMMLPVII